MKPFKLLLVSLLIIIGFSACKKNAQVEEPELTGCDKHAATVPKIILKGTDNVASAVELSMDTTSFDTGFKYYWKLPNGSILEGSTLKIAKLNMSDHRGVFYAYYKTPDSCTSFKNSIVLKLGGVPCSLAQNWFGIDSVYGYLSRPLKAGYATSFSSDYCDIEDYHHWIFVRINRKKIEEGEYTILPNLSFPSKTERYAYLAVKTPYASDHFFNHTGASLYIIKNSVNNYEVFVCNAYLENDKYASEKGNLSLRLLVN